MPSFAADPTVYSEASIANSLDTSFEKQAEINEVKNASTGGIKSLSNDAHSGRFSLKIGKQGLADKVLCQVVNKQIDTSKFNQITLWVKPKGYSSALTFYTMANGQSTTIGSIEAKDLKSEVWQEITLSLSSFSGTVTGLSTWAYGNRTLLIDDICYSKSYTKDENWDLNASSNNTLPTEMAYQAGVGVTLKTTGTSGGAYESGDKVASIENPVSGQIMGININNSKLETKGNTVSTGQALLIGDIDLLNSDFYSISTDGNKVYSYNPSTNCVELKNMITRETKQIYSGGVKQIVTNKEGSILALVNTASALYLLKEPSETNYINFSSKATLITSGAIWGVFLEDETLYYNSGNYLYCFKQGLNTLVGELNYFNLSQPDAEDASQILNSKAYRYRYYTTRWYMGDVRRYDNKLQQPDTFLASTNNYTGIAKANDLGSMVIYWTCPCSSGPISDYYLIVDSDTAKPKNLSLGNITTPYFKGDQLIYYVGTQLYKLDNISKVPVAISRINYAIDIDDSGDKIAYVENYSSLYIITKSYNFDKELLKEFRNELGTTVKPVSSAAIKTAKFSTQPNQVIAQMENGDIYSIDTRTKTSRLLIGGMVFYDVLEGGKLLLSDMKDTGRFLIYDPTSNTKEVFRLDNRSTATHFTIQLNEAAKTVYYLNKDNKMQVLPLTGAETKDKYAFMMNGDSKWWVYKNNTWTTIYNGSDCPFADLMDSMGMTASEVNAISEKAFQKLPENAKPTSLRIAVYFNSNSPTASPVLKSITVSTKDAEADLSSKTAYGTRIKEFNKADFRDVSAIHVTENKDSADEIYYFLVANDAVYSIRNGETCSIGQNATQFFTNVKDRFMDVMSYGMSAKELADMPADSLKQILITNNTSTKFGIVAVIKTVGKDTKEVKLDYILESLQKRFDDSVTKVTITLTDDTLIQYTTPEVSKEEIEKFADWVADRKYNRGPVFFTFHVGGKYKILNYYMIKMFTVE